MNEIKNARIASTMLGIEDHGIMTYFLHLDYDGSGQGAGGYSLGGTRFGPAYLRKIIETVGVDKWESLPGKYIRVEATHNKVLRIGHIIKNVWMDLSEGVGEKP